MTRRCGGCTACCKLLPMKRDAYPREQVLETVGEMVARGWMKPHEARGMLFEWDKPAGLPCQHQRHGKGCAVYNKRPFGCRFWNCRWLVNDDTADLRRPDRSHYVVDVMPDFVTMEPHGGGERTTMEVIQVWVDPDYPDAWRDPALLAFLDRRGQEGKAALIRYNSSDAFTVFPPSLSEDGQWHEVGGQSLGRQHKGDELLEGIASAKKVVWTA